MRRLYILLFIFIGILISGKTTGQSFQKNKIVWFTYLQSADLTEADKLKVLLLNQAFNDQPQYPLPVLRNDLARLIKFVESEAKIRKLPLFHSLDYLRPADSLQGNLFHRYLSRIILNEWYNQNKAFYRTASVKYSNYLLNEDEFSKFSFDADSVYEQAWSLFHSNAQYKALLKEFIQLRIWPDFTLNSLVYDELQFDNRTKSMLHAISDSGAVTISKDSVINLATEQIEAYNESFGVGAAFERYDSRQHGTWDDFLARRKAQRTKDEKLIKNMKEGNQVLKKLLSYYDPATAGKVEKVLENSIDVYDAWSKLQSDLPGIAEDELKTLIAYGTFGYGVIGAAINIYNIFSKPSTLSTDQLILKQIQVLGNKIDTLSKEMHERFDIVDQNMALMLENINTHFNSMMYQLQNITYVTEQTRNDLYELKKSMARIETDILGYLQAATEIRLKDNLTYFLDYKQNFNHAVLSQSEFKRGIQQFADWGISKPKDPLFAGSQANYSFQDAEIASEIRKFSKADVFDLNYFMLFTASRFGKQYNGSTTRKSNQNMWNLGAEAFLQFALDWDTLYQKEVTPSLVNQLIDVGEGLKFNYNAILQHQGRVDAGLMQHLVNFHKSKINSLQQKYESFQQQFLAASDVDVDTRFSIWEIKQLNEYKLTWPDRMHIDTQIVIDRSYYAADVIELVNLAEPVRVNLPLLYNPAGYPTDSSNILKYASILNLDSMKLRYNFWEYTTSTYKWPGIDIDPGKLVFAPSFTKYMNGLMIVEGHWGNQVVYRRAKFLPGIYYKGNERYSKLALVRVEAMQHAKPGYFPDRFLRTSYQSLFEEIWNKGEVRKVFLLDPIRGIANYNPNESLEMVKLKVMNELLHYQNRSYQMILDNEADLASTYQSLDGALKLYEAFYSLGMPNVAEFDSLRQFLHGRHQLMDTRQFKKILSSFIEFNEKVIRMRGERTAGVAIDSLIAQVFDMYKRNDLVRLHFDLKVHKFKDDFYISWKENIFRNELDKVDQFHQYSRSIFQKIDTGEIKVNYPKVEPLLNKLYQFKSYYHVNQNMTF